MLNKRTLKFLFAAIVGLLATVSSVSAQEKTAEPTKAAVPQIGTALDFPILESGKPLNFSFKDTDGAILTAFDATKGDLVTMSMKRVEEIFPFLLLFGPEGQILAYNQGQQTTSDALIENFEIPADGRYFLYVGESEHYSMAGDARLVTKVSLLIKGNNRPAEMKDDAPVFLAANALIGDSFDIAITEESSAYYVLFDGEKDQKVTLDALSKKLDTHLALFDATGHRIMVNEDKVEFQNTNAHIEVELPRTGSYFLIVTTFELVAIANHDGPPVEGIIDFSIHE